jgi:hypothetical protein
LLRLLVIVSLLFAFTMPLFADEVAPDIISRREVFRAKLLASKEVVKQLHQHKIQVTYLANLKWQKYPTEINRVTLISSDHQQVIHFVDGLPKFIYICSTRAKNCGKERFGWYVFDYRERSHWSKKYHVWMPYAIHFDGAVFLHATQKIRQLGHRASHGCIRLHPRDAKEFYNSNPVGTPVFYTQ